MAVKFRKALGVRGTIVNKGQIFRVPHEDGDGFDDYEIRAEDFAVRGNGVEGLILYCPFRVDENDEIIPDPDRGHFFRVYHRPPASDDRADRFTDYDPNGIEFLIEGGDVVFVETPNRKFLTWDSIKETKPGMRTSRAVIRDHKIVKDESGKPVRQWGTIDEDLRWIPDAETKDERPTE